MTGSLRMWLCVGVLTRAQRNPRLATWGRSFHPDYQRRGRRTTAGEAPVNPGPAPVNGAGSVGSAGSSQDSDATLDSPSRAGAALASRPSYGMMGRYALSFRGTVTA
jgi:hypothetical protein